MYKVNEDSGAIHSLNYTHPYKIFWQTRGIFTCNRVGCTYSLNGCSYNIYPRSWYGSHYLNLAITFSLFFCGYHWCTWIHETCWDRLVFLMYWPWLRIEADYNRAVNKISELFSAMRLGVEVIMWHVWSCVYHLKCLSGLKHVYLSDQDIKRYGLRSDYICQDSFNYLLVVII